MGDYETTTNLVEHAAEPTPMMIIQTAMQSDCDPDKLEKLMALQERWDASQERKAIRAAELAYNAAMSRCQADIEPVKASLKNDQTRSLYADLCAIDDAIRPVYTKHGFSISGGSGKSELDKHIHVYIDVLHADGHARQYGDDFPLDDAGIQGKVNKTPIHAKASTISYARRYLICSVFNVAIARTDRDGNQPPAAISEVQVGILQGLIDSIHPDEDALGALMQWASIEKLESLPSNLFLQAKQALEVKAKKYEGTE